MFLHCVFWWWADFTPTREKHACVYRLQNSRKEISLHVTTMEKLTLICGKKKDPLPLPRFFEAHPRSGCVAVYGVFEQYWKS